MTLRKQLDAEAHFVQRR